MKTKRIYRRTGTYYVYILQCSDGSYYTGFTNDLERRMREHHMGRNPGSYTYSRRPVVLKYSRVYPYVLPALEWERQIKGWSRKKKEALIAGDYNRLIWLSNMDTPHRLRQAQLRQAQSELRQVQSGSEPEKNKQDDEKKDTEEKGSG